MGQALLGSGFPSTCTHTLPYPPPPRYETVEAAIAVHQSLQGAVIPSSDRGGMRIQYSKNPFGIKRGGA